MSATTLGTGTAEAGVTAARQSAFAELRRERRRALRIDAALREAAAIVYDGLGARDVARLAARLREAGIDRLADAVERRRATVSAVHKLAAAR
jgi:hypothetical protein